MTNKQLVSEVRRVIRGIAMNYPEGLIEIAREVDALRVPAPEDVGVDVLRQENATHTSEQDSAAPKAQVAGNTQGGETQQVAKRKRGRPRKVRP